MGKSAEEDFLKQQFENCTTKLAEGKVLTMAEMEFVQEYQSRGKVRLNERGEWITSQKRIAEHLGVTEKTVKVWLKTQVLPLRGRTAGESKLGWFAADLTDAYNKHKGLATEAHPEAIEGDVSQIQAGAEFALQRLNNDEAQCFADYLAAKKTKDIKIIKSYRELWKQALDDQRKQEKAIDAERRELGELLSQAQAEQMFIALGMAMLTACDKAIKRAASSVAGMKSERLIAQNIRDAVFDCSLASMDMAVRASRMPSWVLESVRVGANLAGDETA